MNGENKIRYRDLSKPLKFLVVYLWFLFGIFCFYFFIGVIEGIIIYGMV